jgi:hypothetical protein
MFNLKNDYDENDFTYGSSSFSEAFIKAKVSVEGLGVLEAIKKIIKPILGFFKSNKTIDKESIESLLDVTIESTQGFKVSIGELRKVDLDNFYELVLSKLSTHTGKVDFNTGIYHLNFYQQGLNIAAKTYEKSKGYFSSMFLTTDLFLQLLTSLKTDINTLIEDEIMTISEIKLSTLALVNVIKTIDTAINCFEYIFSILLDSGLGKHDTIPKYRLKYLTEHLPSAIKCVNDLSSKQGFYNFLISFQKIKNSSADVPVIVENAPNSFAFVNGNKDIDTLFGGGVNSYGSADEGVKGIFFIGSIAQWITKWQHSKYLKNQSKISWFKDRITLIKFQLNNESEDSPKYQKLVKVIEAYEKRILDLDKKILEYMSEAE